MTDPKFSDFIRNATPEEKAKVYGEVMDEACEMQRKALADTEEGRDRLKAPITPDDFGVPAEWRERAENYARWLADCGVNALARQLAEANARTAMLEADRSRLTACPWRVQKGLTSHRQPPKRLREALDQAEAAERRAAEVGAVLNKAYEWREKLHRCLRRGHHCEATVAADAVKQSIDAAIAAGEK